VWYTRDELARDSEVLLLRWGVLYKSGVHAGKALLPYPGRSARRLARAGLRGEKFFLTAVQKSAEGIVEAKAPKARTV
jgi:hypothetical protein